MKKMIIAEKPSVAMSIKKALGIKGKRYDGYFEDDSFIVTWCVGHLVQMSYPEKYGKEYETWNLDYLPFIPEKDAYLYEPNEDVKKQFQVVKKLYHRQDIDKLYIFPDPAQEGYYLQALVLMHAQINPNIQIFCAPCDSQTEDEIIKTYNNARSWNSPEFANMVYAGYMRAKEDYLIGINYSRALTVKYKDYLSECLSDNKKVVAVGRVMSVVLSMVVKREREIANFQSQKYYKIEAMVENIVSTWKATASSSHYMAPYIYENKGFMDKERKDKFIKSLPPHIKLEKKEIKKEKKTAPLLYSLTELQADCSKRFKMNPQKVLMIAQALYEKKMTTYPRTDSKYLTTAIAKEIGTNLAGLSKTESYGKYAEQILKDGGYKTLDKTRYVNDSKVEDHYAIIPTGEGETESLKEEEKLVYDAIVKRFLSIFLPAAIYKKAELEFLAGRESFFYTKKELINPGYMALYDVKEKTEKDFEIIDGFIQGEMYKVNYLASEVETAPPKRYTSDSLLLAMDNAGKFVEDEELREVLTETKGIGTTATRAGIIEKLIKGNEYLSLDEKTQIYKPRYKGEIIYDILEETLPQLLDPAFSASWTKGLKQIEKGVISDVVYYQKLSMDIKKHTEKIITEDRTFEIRKKHQKLQKRYKKEIKEASIIYECPVCKKPLKKTSKGLCCSDYGKEEGKCKFFLSYIINGKQLSATQIGKLLTERKLDTVSGFKKKDGTPFSSPLYIWDGGEVRFVPPDNMNSEVKCPKCDANFNEETYAWTCPNCELKIPRMVCGKKISYENFKRLARGQETPYISGFQKKDGKTFDAKLVLTAGEIKFIFRSGQVKGIYCPLCRKEIEYSSFGMKCKDYKNGCTFAIGSQVCGKTLSDEQLIRLINEKQIPETKGFVSNNGETFSSALYLDKSGKLKFGYLPKKINLLCPKCQGGYLTDTGKYITCDKCKSNAPSIYCGKRLSQDDISNLMIYGRTGRISGFKKKDGGKFSAVLIKDANNKFRFE